MRHPTLVDGVRGQPPMLAVIDSAGRARRRVLALFLPVTAALYRTHQPVAIPVSSP